MGPIWARIGRAQNTLTGAAYIAATVDRIPGHIGGYLKSIWKEPWS